MISDCCTWHMGSSWYTPDFHIVATDIFDVHHTMAPWIVCQLKKKLVSSVCSQEVTVRFMFVPVANHLVAMCFVRGKKRWNSLDVRSQLSEEWFITSQSNPLTSYKPSYGARGTCWQLIYSSLQSDAICHLATDT